MSKRYLRFPYLFFAGLFILIIFISGCETFKGMKKDWENITKWDKEFQEVLW